MKLLFGLILTCALLAFDARTDTWMSVTTKKGVPMSQEPGTNQAEVGFVPFKGVVTVLAADGPQTTLQGVTAKWYRVEYQGKVGWVFSGFLKTAEPPRLTTHRRNQSEQTNNKSKPNEVASGIEDDSGYFLMPKRNSIQYYSEQFSKYLEIKRNTNKYPLYTDGSSDDPKFKPIEITDLQRKFLKTGRAYMEYINGFYGNTYVAVTDMEFVKVTAESKAKFGFLGTFICRPAQNAIECKLRGSGNVQYDEVFKTLPAGESLRRFDISKSTVFFGHYFLASEDGRVDLCGLAPYRESKNLPKVTKKTPLLEWNIFSSDGRTLDAVNLRHWQVCQ